MGTSSSVQQIIDMLINENQELREKNSELAQNNRDLNEKNIELNKKADEFKLSKEEEIRRIQNDLLIKENTLKDFEQKRENDSNEKKELQKKIKSLQNILDNINKVFENKTKFLNNIKEQNIINSVEENFKLLLENKTNNIKEKVNEVLTTNENFLNKIEGWKQNALKESINDFINKTKHINIILLGKTGTGKSTLINGLLGKDVSKESGFRPETIENKSFEGNILRLWDTQGFESDDKINAQKIVDNAKQLIKDSEQKGPDWFIHCIWYCVTGYRFENVEENAIRELTQSYEDDKLPLIIVYTHTLSEKAVDDLRDGIRQTFEERKIEFISVLAKDEKKKNGEIIAQKFGLEDLVIKTMDKFKNSIDSMSYHFVLNNTKKTVKNRINNLKNNNNLNSNNLNNSICDFYSKLLGKLNMETVKLINEGLDDIISSCKNDISFEHNISKDIAGCQKQLFKNFDLTNEIKQFIIDSIKKEIQLRYKNAKDQFFENKLNEQIFSSYASIIISLSDSLITDKLKKIKNILIPKLQKEIENSPNFKKIFNKSKNALDNINEFNENTETNSNLRKKKLDPIKKVILIK